MGASVLGQCAQHRAKLVCFCVIINASTAQRIRIIAVLRVIVLRLVMALNAKILRFA